MQPYYRLSKPGIIYGNLLTAAAGFLFAAKFHIHVILFLATLVGTALVIASACVFNNYLDRGIDGKMARTAKRALVAGTISNRNALIYATIVGLIGFSVLLLKTNHLTFVVGLIAFIVYVLVYGYAKRRGAYGTLVGSIAGAAPVVAGYLAVTDHLNGAVIVLFLILALWQMPHFYAISMYRRDDYKAAGIPVLSVAKGMQVTRQRIVVYIVGFTLACLSLTWLGYTGVIYLVIMLILGVSWLYLGVWGYRALTDSKWARKMFLYSLIVILVTALMLAIGPVLR